jgi:hypothetical protein
MGQRRKDGRFAIPGAPDTSGQPERPGVAPVQGKVLEWRRHFYRWIALVLISGVDGQGRPTATQQ